MTVFSFRLKETLTRLLLDCGWKEEVNLMCRRVILEKGVNNVTPEEIVKEVTPAARGINFITYLFIE